MNSKKFFEKWVNKKMSNKEMWYVNRLKEMILDFKRVLKGLDTEVEVDLPSLTPGIRYDAHFGREILGFDVEFPTLKTKLHNKGIDPSDQIDMSIILMLGVDYSLLGKIKYSFFNENDNIVVDLNHISDKDLLLKVVGRRYNNILAMSKANNAYMEKIKNKSVNNFNDFVDQLDPIVKI